MYAEPDWIVNNETAVRPDAMIVCGKSDTDRLMFPPVLILEITSASTCLKDKNIQYKLYEMNEVPYYLLADTEQKKIACYQLNDRVYQPKQDSVFRLSADCEIEIDSEKIWQ